ncbi:MAG: hypothetical protein H6629_21480 [Calditrichae bacterium]|nr:hypothetical protein [Calditrichia bacterium]
MEGYDNNWIDAGNRRSAFYTNLPRGEYTFRVKACNNDGVWNETGAAITFTIPPVWFETWWAKASSVSWRCPLWCWQAGCISAKTWTVNVCD